jgi:hypothetical protein
MNRSLTIIGLIVLAFGPFPCAAQEGKEGKDKDPRREKLLAARNAWSTTAILPIRRAAMRWPSGR